MNDIEDILTDEGMIEDVHFILNRSDHTYTFSKGSVIRFFSADDWGKVKGSRRDVLFINEWQCVQRSASSWIGTLIRNFGTS